MDGLKGLRLLTLRIRNLRNLRSVDLDLRQRSQRILLTGANGAGKTTLLEAVYLLARGRSFRGRKAGSLTSDGERRTLVEGRFCEVDSSSESILVFERSGRGSLRRYNSVAMGPLPPSDSPLRVKLVGENPQVLLEGEPTLRRGLLDWNVFHVEHQFGRLRADVRRVLAQRNAALRQGGARVSAWDPAFVELSDQLTVKRMAFLDRWRTQFRSLAEDFAFLDGCDLFSIAAGRRIPICWISWSGGGARRFNAVRPSRVHTEPISESPATALHRDFPVARQRSPSACFNSLQNVSTG